MYKRLLTSFSLFALMVGTQVYSLTQQEIVEHKDNFLRVLLHNSSVSFEKAPKIYTPEELIVLTEGRYCLDKPAQASSSNTHEKANNFEIVSHSDSSKHQLTQFNQGPESSNAAKSPYTYDNTYGHNQCDTSNRQNLQCSPKPVRSHSVIESPTRHDFYCSIKNPNPERKDQQQRIQQHIQFSLSSAAKRAYLFERMKRFTGVDFLNFIFGTSFTDYTSQSELEDFIFDHADQLLNNYVLYPSTRYHQFLYHQVPGYRTHMQQVYSNLLESNKAWQNIQPQGIDKTWFKKHIARMYEHFNDLPEVDHDRLQQWKFEKQRATILKNYATNRHQAEVLFNNYHSMIDDWQSQKLEDSLNSSVLDRYQQRTQALAKSYTQEPLFLSNNEYVLSAETQAMLAANHLDVGDFTSCLGSPIAQQLHQELLSVLDHASSTKRVYNDQESTQWSNMVAEHADIACSYNKMGNIIQATQWTDACWILLDYAHAIGQGIFEGTIKASCFAAIATIAPLVPQAMLAGTAAYMASMSGWTLGELGHAYHEGGAKAVINQLKSYKKICHKLIDDLDKQWAQLSTHDKMRSATALVTEVAVIPKILKLAKSVRTLELREIQTLLKKIKSKAKNLQLTDLLYKINDPTPQPGYISLPSTKISPQIAYSASQARSNLSIDNQIIQHPWLTNVLNHKMIRYMKKQNIIIKQYASNTTQKIKLYIMPTGLDEKITNGLQSIKSQFRPNAHIRNHLKKPIEQFTLTEDRLAHVLGVEITHDVETGAHFFSGFHYDPRDLLKNSGIFKLRNPSENTITKIVSADVKLAKECLFNAIVEEDTFSKKTFFPSDWSAKEILKNAQEALTNSYNPVKTEGNKYIITGKSNNNTQIKFVIDSVGNIISFYIEQIIT